jgi:hypothetical protein
MLILLPLIFTSTIKFELDSNHFIHLGTNHNLKDIENIQIIENGEVSDFDQNKSQIESRDIMEYIMLYNHEKKIIQIKKGLQLSLKTFFYAL